MHTPTTEIPSLHIIATMRLTDVKTRDKLMPLLQSRLVRKVTLVRFAPVKLESDKLTQVIYDLGVRKSWTLFTGLKNAWMSFWTMLRLARTESPDVLIAFYLVPHGLVAWLAARVTHKKAIVSLIGSDFHRSLNLPLFGRAITLVLRDFDAVAIFGEEVRQALVRFGVPAQRVFVLPNTADVSVFYPDSSVQPDVDLIYTGALRDFKRVDLLLRALHQVCEIRPQTSLLVVGDGPERVPLERLAQSLGLAERVEFYGQTDQVADQLRRARVFVMLSEHEGLPMAMIEAMCTGLPVVVTHVGAIDSVVCDGENGYLVPSPADPALVAGRILRLLDDPEHYQQLSKAALRVRETHGYEQTARIWDDIFTAALRDS